MSKKSTKNHIKKHALDKPAIAGSSSPRVSGRGAATRVTASSNHSSDGTAKLKRDRRARVPASTPTDESPAAKPVSEDNAPAATIAPSLIERDPRLPPVGTMLVKRDRFGRARCECKIEEGGFRYGHTLHRSLSAAASAAATDLGIRGSVNGFVFWGLVKPPRPAVNPVEDLHKIAIRYTDRATAFLSREISPAGREAIRRELEGHTTQLAELLAKSAA